MSDSGLYVRTLVWTSLGGQILDSGFGFQFLGSNSALDALGTPDSGFRIRPPVLFRTRVWTSYPRFWIPDLESGFRFRAPLPFGLSWDPALGSLESDSSFQFRSPVSGVEVCFPGAGYGFHHRAPFWTSSWGPRFRFPVADFDFCVRTTVWTSLRAQILASGSGFKFAGLNSDSTTH